MSGGGARPALRTRPAPNCYLCGAAGERLYRGRTDRMFSAPGAWDTLSCKTCGLAWLDPQPVPEEIPKLYDAYYTHPVANAGGGGDRWVRRLKRNARRAVLAASYGYRAGAPAGSAVFGRLLAAIPVVRETVGASIRWLPAAWRGRLLDVGCGGGDFLAEMQSLGWDVAGIEPDATAASAARARLGVTVEGGTAETSAFPAGSFDVVTLNHVIEHVPDPITTLRACGRLLRTGGTLVLVTPNIESLGRRVFDGAWMHWDPPRHLHIFSRRALRACVQRAGLVTERLWTSAQGVRPSWSTSRLIQKHGHATPQIRSRTPLRTTLEEVGALLVEDILNWMGGGWGEEIVLLARHA